jgi:hypothetical protein
MEEHSSIKFTETLLLLLFMCFLIISCTNQGKQITDVINNSRVDSDNSKVAYTSADIDLENNYSNSTKLMSIEAFDAFRINIPEFLKLTNSKQSADFSNMTFVSPSAQISIILRHQVYSSLPEIKEIFGPVNEKNFRSDIIKVNDIDAYVLDRKICSLQENANEMRLWIRLGEETYSLLLIYPEKYFETTKMLRESIVNSLTEK